jgi:16S rRNA (adenine1518-N6/adenine1519-N6)-dimethyltransferase
VAYRLVAKPGNKQYGSPTAKANWWVDLAMAGSVSRSVFWPVPNVDSALVSFVRHYPLGNEHQRSATFSIIDQAFAKRRKMMRSAIGDLFEGEAENYLIAAGIDPTIRGEALAVEQFFKIGEQLLAQNLRK